VGKPDRGPSIFPVVLASVAGFDPPGVVKNERGVLEGNAMLAQVSCRFAGIPFKFHCVVIVISFCSYVKFLSAHTWQVIAHDLLRLGLLPLRFPAFHLSHCCRCCTRPAAGRSPAAL